MKNILINKIETREAVAGIVGLGYVGLPLAVEFAKAGFKTIGFDVQESKVEQVNNGRNYIGDIENQVLTELVANNMLKATTDFAEISKVDFIAICVPTPLDRHQQPDISFVEVSATKVSRHLSPNTIVVLESTTYPGTTEELVKPILEKGSGLKCGEDFYLGFSPERVDPGNAVFKTSNTPKVIGAIGNDAQAVIGKMYSTVLSAEIHSVSSPATAEMCKILENTYRNINIGLINEMAVLCNKMGINIWEVIEAAKTKPFGYMPFYPGPGLGGHCIPLDPYYLSWKAREYGVHTSMIEASMIINDHMPDYVIERCADILNNHNKPIRNSKILILGIAYKKNVADYRESPALIIIDQLKAKGANISFFDPHIPAYKRNGETVKGETQLTADLLKAQDLVVVTTAHTQVDYELVQRNSVAIFDTRNAMKQVKERGNIGLI